MGSRILAGRYELLGKIGEGGMAVVFKAKDRLLNRHVAVKILKPEFTKDLVFIESFRRESQTAAGLVHPNIVNVYDVGKEGNIYYIVMELIDGKPLAQIIREEGALEPRRAATITRQVASALAAAHKHQLIHRDVKPHNIMLTAEGTAKITDFGIAKAISTGTLVEGQAEAVMGSVHYFSPEQARGGYVDEKSDIYALGIVLYEMLTGKVPFDGETAVAVAVKHMNEAMVPPSRLNPEIPADLEEIVMRATSKLQINRYRSADEMITALNFVKYSKPVAGLAAVGGHSPSGEPPAGALSTQEAKKEEGSAIRHSGAESGKKKAKGGKKVVFHPEKLAVILLALALAIPASGLVYKAIMGASASKDVKVPDLVGLTQEEALEALSPAGLSLEVEMELPSVLYEEGKIISQSPKAEAEVKPGIAVRVNVSKGRADGTVPSVEGKPLSGAKYILETYGYKAGSVTEAFSDTVPAGIVISQEPERGTELAGGSQVDLRISLGPEFVEIELDNLRDNTLSEATLYLESLGLSLGTVTYADDPAVAEDCVITHTPGPGTLITEPLAVDLVICRPGEPAQPDEPDEGGGQTDQNSVAITLDYSLADQEEFLLTVNVADGVFDPRTPINKEPRSRSDGSEVISLSGAGRNGTIKIWYDNELVYDLAVDFLSREVE